MAMTDYPNEASFLQPMPAWPVSNSCQAFKDVEPLDVPQPKNATRRALILNALKAASDTYFNHTG